MDYKEKNMTILYRLSTVSGARWLEELHRIYNTDIVIKYNKATETKEDSVHYEKEKKWTLTEKKMRYLHYDDSLWFSNVHLGGLKRK